MMGIENSEVQLKHNICLSWCDYNSQVYKFDASTALASVGFEGKIFNNNSHLIKGTQQTFSRRNPLKTIL